MLELRCCRKPFGNETKSDVHMCFYLFFIYLFVMSLFYMNSFLESGETEIHPLSQCSLVTHRDTTLPLECNKLLSFLEEVVSVLTHSFLPSFVL